MGLEFIPGADPAVAEALTGELAHQRGSLYLVASGNYLSPAVLEAQGAVVANERAEGYPGARYFAGCDHVDEIEELAIERARELFGADHVNVQPHSGTQSNMGVYVAVLDPGDTILSLELSHGGHLSHGHPANFAGQYYDIVQYGIDLETGRIDYDELAATAREHDPAMIVTGFSAYPREIDWERVQSVADEVGAYHMADIAHITGLVAADEHPSPVGVVDFVTGSTHKSLRAGRGGFIMCDADYASDIDAGVFPGSQGDPLMHNVAGKAVGFREALEHEFEEYAAQVVANADALAATLTEHGLELLSGGTDTHLLLIDLRESHPDMTGKDAESILETVGVVLNANPVPGDTRPPTVTSGIRIGTPAVTTRGLDESDMETLGELVVRALDNPDDDETIAAIGDRVDDLCDAHPLYEQYD
ncbi:serine hydroxymethyltransferase [Halobacteriales archaeon QS_1_68_17]|nr:MAG: serine hydroxymethyltransferase [Halobacteriales archaeon QS_1_68_17]